MQTFNNYSELKHALDTNQFRFLPEYGPAQFKCSVCGDYKPLNTTNTGCSTGYGADRDTHEMFCLECCGRRDREAMERGEKTSLYLSGRCLTNWPGTLRINVRHMSHGHHNLAGTRTDVWFAFAGREWHGTVYGNNTQLCHCKPLGRRH
jgi:hypothetical protein